MLVYEGRFRTNSTGTPCVCTHCHFKVLYLADLPISVAKGLVTGNNSPSGSLYGVHWISSNRKKNLSGTLRTYFWNTDPPCPPHFEISFGNNNVRAVFTNQLPPDASNPTRKQRDLGHDLAAYIDIHCTGQNGHGCEATGVIGFTRPTLCDLFDKKGMQQFH